MEISSKEDFKVAFDKIPDYKIRKEKVSPVFEKLAFSLERKNCEFSHHQQGWIDLNTNKIIKYNRIGDDKTFWWSKNIIFLDGGDREAACDASRDNAQPQVLSVFFTISTFSSSIYTFSF